MRVALCLTGILGGASGRNGNGGSIHPAVGCEYWKEALSSADDVDVFIHSWSTEATNTLVELYKPKKHIIEQQKHFTPAMENYGELDIETLLSDRRYSDIAEEYDRSPGSTEHPSLINGDSENLWDHLKYQAWCQHSKWYANQQAIKLKSEYEKENNFIYDFVVLSRFDLWFNKPFPFHELTQESFYASPRNHGYDYREDHDIALMDLWFLAPSKMMNSFADLYDEIYKYCIIGTKASRERIAELFGEDKLEYLFWDHIDYGAVRHKYGAGVRRFISDEEETKVEK